MPAARFLADLFRRIKLFEYISKNNPQGDVAEEKSRMVRQIADLAYAGRYSVRALLNELEELSSSFVAADSSSDEDRLLVTSCHRAKGLEFPLVILPDLAEGLFPRCSIDSTAGDIADERRLFYVAATRAIKELILITPLDRQLLIWSKERRSGHPPVDQILASRFLYESNIELSVVAGDAIGKSAALPTGNQSRVLSTYIDGIAQAND